MKFYENLSQRLENLKNSPYHIPRIIAMKKYYEAHKDKPVISISYDTFMEFFRSGSRAHFEENYSERRFRLYCAAMLYLLEKEDKYLQETCNMIWHICSEFQWCLTAHLAGRRIDRYRNEIDLGAAETAACLAEIYTCLGESLPQNIRDIIKKEVDDRIFSRFDNESVYWETKLNNWAAVCGGDIGIAYMLLAPERFENVKPRLLSTMETFLASYGEDGCCQEGVGYWNYGFSRYLYFADLLYDFTNGKDDIRHSEKIDKIALFIQNVMLRGNIAISFSDSRRTLKHTNLEMISYLYTNYEGYKVPDFDYESGDGAVTYFTTILRTFLWWNPNIKKGDGTLTKDYRFFESAQWYINRKENYSFAAKGGHNDEPHNHNDIGNFIFATDKGQILADVGSMEYTRDNFNENRYKYLQNASWGHSVPIIGERVQLKGKEYAAEILSVEENKFALKINGAYGKDCPEILREFEMLENGVVLKDTFGETNEKITERFISVTEPKITENGVEIADGVIKADSIPVITSQTLINHSLKPETIYIIDYTVSGNKFALEIDIK